MSDDGSRSLNHFALYRFKETYWSLEPNRRINFQRAWIEAFEPNAECVHMYQISPTEAESDFLVWSALPLTDDSTTSEYFSRAATSLARFRDLVTPTRTLWGYTAPSTYSRARSAQEIDPFTNERKRYLIIYPFTKTQEWYLLGKDARQGMMNEHIRLGKTYTQISQLLLYSFGVQDHEFVVVYETDDLPQFSDLVRELRSTDARPYTERDTPLHTAIYHTPQATLDLWTGS